MKFTSKDLMKAIGLQVGDRIKINNQIYTIIEYTKGSICYSNNLTTCNLRFLIGAEFEIIRLKRVGDVSCKDNSYVSCPLGFLCDYLQHDISDCKNLYEVLERYHIQDEDPDLYNLFKARLDKEVEEWQE